MARHRHHGAGRGGVFCAFSYLSPLLTDVAGLDSQWVPWILGLFGIGALAGTTVGGRVADAHLFGVMIWGVTASTVFLAALALLASSATAAVALAFLLGFSAFFTAPALNARMFNVVAPPRPWPVPPPRPRSTSATPVVPGSAAPSSTRTWASAPPPGRAPP